MTRTILLRPRGAPDPGTSWSDPVPRRVAVTAEDTDAWYGAPIDNPACPTLTWPRFAWQEITPQPEWLRRAQAHELPARVTYNGRG